MLKIGLTGGIGSGKSTIAKVFLSLGIPVYNADFESKRITNTNPEIKRNLEDFYGSEIFINNALNKKLLASIIFKDRLELKRVNELIHPFVLNDFENWCEAYQEKPYCIKEAAIIFESQTDKLLDKVICVSATEEIRIKRVMRRDNVDRDAVIARMQNQMSDEERIKRSDFVIENNFGPVLDKILRIHKELIELK